MIEAANTILAPFDKVLQDAAIEQFDKKMKVRCPLAAKFLPSGKKITELLLHRRVKEVKEHAIILDSGEEIPYGMAVWAGGNGPLPITLQVINGLGEEQAKEQNSARGRIAIDPWLRAIGGDGSVFAIGDCTLMADTPLPANAQAASQQGAYLARLLALADVAAYDSGGNLLPPKRDLQERGLTLPELIASTATHSRDFAAPFQFLNLGILAYTGNQKALAQIQVAPGDCGRLDVSGSIGFGLWQAVYLFKQLSLKNQVSVVLDWIKMRAFGRDISRMGK